jgi:hypothetical protein
MSFKQIGEACGQKWKNLSAEDKKPYEEKAKELTAAYKEAVAKVCIRACVKRARVYVCVC